MAKITVAALYEQMQSIAKLHDAQVAALEARIAKLEATKPQFAGTYVRKPIGSVTVELVKRYYSAHPGCKPPTKQMLLEFAERN